MAQEDKLGVLLAHMRAMEDAQVSFRGSVTQGQRPESTTSSRLQELDKGISQILLRIRDLRNTHSSKVAGLHDNDILPRILEQACVVQTEHISTQWNHSSIFCDTPVFSGSMVRILSGVCRQWRSLLLSNPIVWSDVRVTIRRPENLLWLEGCLARSESAPGGCTVEIAQPDPTQAVNITEVISRYQNNIRRLKVNPGTEKDYDFLSLNMENLERLHIDSGAPSRTIIPAPITSRLPKLREVILQNFSEVPRRVFFNITELTLIDTTFPMAITNLIEIFQANQTLEVVRMINTVVANYPQAEEGLAPLPKLKLLCTSRFSPVNILRILSPLPTTSRVIIHDDPTNFAVYGIPEVLHPSLLGSDNLDPIASMSVTIEEKLVTIRTSVGAAVEIATQTYQQELCHFLEVVSRWKALVHLRSMHLHIKRRTGPIGNRLVHALLSGMPMVTHLSFQGRDLCFHIGKTLNVAGTSKLICPRLKCLDGTLHPDDRVDDDMRSLREALETRPGVWNVAVNSRFLEAGDITQMDPFTGDTESRGLSFAATLEPK